MCEILLSINPQHVENIFNGSKKYEFRRVKCRERIDKIIIYATAPIMKVVGEAQVENVLSYSPQELWKKTSEESGIEVEFFNEYFKGKLSAFAYQLGSVSQYKNPKELSEFGVKSAPQSFVYIKNRPTISREDLTV